MEFMVFVFFVCVLCIFIYFCHLVADYAQKNGLTYSPIFLLGVITTPVISFIVTLIMASNAKKVQNEYPSCNHDRKCPFCAEYIKMEAVICRFCNRDLPAYIKPIETAIIEPEPVVIYPYECRRCGLRYKDEEIGCPECQIIS